MPWGDIALWIYVIGAVIAWPFTARYLLREAIIYGEAEAIDYAMAVMLGVCVAPFWPLCVPGFWIVEWLRREDAA